MADKIEKIYVIRAEGSGAVIKDLRTMNQLYKDFAKSKAAFEAQKRSSTDPAEIARLNTELGKLAEAETQLATVNQNRLSAARQEIQLNREAIGTVEQLTASITSGGAGQTAALDAIGSAQVQMAQNTAAGTEAIQQQTAALAGETSAQNTVSAAIAAGNAVEQQATASVLSHEEAQAALNAEYEQTKADAAEAQAVTNEMAAATQGATVANVEAADSFIAVSGTVALLKESLAENKAEMALVSAQYEAGTITQAEYTAQMGSLIETERTLQAELKEANTQLGFQIQEERVGIQSINALRLANKQLTAERNALNLSTVEGQERLAVLNATLNANNELIKKNVDLYTKQKINIGNYPTMQAELNALKIELQELYAAGQKDTVMFQQLSARAQGLTVAMAEVTAATKAQNAAQSGLASGATKAFSALRMAANILPGIGLAGLLGLFIEGITMAIDKLGIFETKISGTDKALKKYKETLKQVEEQEAGAAQAEIAQINVLTKIAADTTASMKDRLAAVKELQTTYPERFGALTKEAILEGKVAEAVNQTTQELIARASAQAATNKIAAAGEKRYSIFKDQQKIQKDLNDATATYNDLNDVAMKNSTNARATDAAVSALRRVNSLKSALATTSAELVKADKEIADFQKDAQMFARQAGSTFFGKGPTGKTPEEKAAEAAEKAEKAAEAARRRQETADRRAKSDSDKAAKDKEAAGKALIDASANLQKQQVQQDIEANKEIFENDQETLADRLLAYENFLSDRQLQNEIAAKQEIDTNQAAIDKIDAQLADKKVKRTAAEIANLQALRKAAEINIQAAREQLAADNQRLATDRLKGTKAIINSEVQQLLDGIPAIKQAEQDKGNERLKVLKKSYEDGQITLKEFKKKEKQITQETALAELEAVKTFLQAQIAAYAAVGASADGLQKALSDVETAIKKIQGAINSTVDETAFNWKQFYEKLTAEAINAADTIAKGWVDSRQKQIDKENELAQTNLDNEKQIRLSAAKTADEKLAIEAEYNQKQEALQKQEFEKNKKLAEAQLAIEFALASMRAISAAFYKGEGWVGALAAEALVALEYAAKLAVLESSHFGAGGEVPADGGQFGGRPHGSGGTDFFFRGQQFNAEAGELAILNKKSSRSGVRYMVSGTTKQIASALNSVGGGVNFAPGASMGRFEYGGSLGGSLPAPYFSPSGGLDSDALRGFINTVGEGFSAVNSRMDRLQVVIDPKAVQNANEKGAKNVKMGTL